MISYDDREPSVHACESFWARGGRLPLRVLCMFAVFKESSTSSTVHDPVTLIACVGEGFENRIQGVHVQTYEFPLGFVTAANAHPVPVLGQQSTS